MEPSLIPSNTPTFLPTCAASNFVDQTFYVVMLNACYRFEFKSGGLLDRSSNVANCDPTTYTPDVDLSQYSGISNNKFSFISGTSTGGYSGQISIRLDSSASSNYVQILSLDDSALTFLGNLVVSSC